MADVFISHVAEDFHIVKVIAAALEASGLSTWYYERDMIVGVSYLLLTCQTIEDSKAFLIIISTHTLGSHQITKEIVRAHEEDKPILPVLIDITDAEFKMRQPEWREAIGAAASITLDRGISEVVASILQGLTVLGIPPVKDKDGEFKIKRKGLINLNEKLLGDLEGRIKERTISEQKMFSSLVQPTMNDLDELHGIYLASFHSYRDALQTTREPLGPDHSLLTSIGDDVRFSRPVRSSLRALVKANTAGRGIDTFIKSVADYLRCGSNCMLEVQKDIDEHGNLRIDYRNRLMDIFSQEIANEDKRSLAIQVLRDFVDSLQQAYDKVAVCYKKLQVEANT